jgi:hypothetical protein
VLLVATALGGLNFNNNLALLLGFLLAAVSQLTTLLAYRNLNGLTVTTILADPVFCGEAAQFRIYLKNPEARHRFSLEVRGDDSRDSGDIKPQDSTMLALEQ